MLADKVRERVVDFYKSLHEKGFDAEDIILIGSAALVLHGVESYAADIDALVPSRRKFAELQRLFNDDSCPISYEKNGTRYQLGLPHDFYILKPYNAKETVKVENVKVNLRPLRLIARDYESYVRSLEEAAKRIGEPLSVLDDFPPYVKYKARLEKLKKVLFKEV
jgi:uncharacterized protein (UPF0210 family)